MSSRSRGTPCRSPSKKQKLERTENTSSSDVTWPGCCPEEVEEIQKRKMATGKLQSPKTLENSKSSSPQKGCRRNTSSSAEVSGLEHKGHISRKLKHEYETDDIPKSSSNSRAKFAGSKKDKKPVSFAGLIPKNNAEEDLNIARIGTEIPDSDQKKKEISVDEKDKNTFKKPSPSKDQTGSGGSSAELKQILKENDGKNSKALENSIRKSEEKTSLLDPKARSVNNSKVDPRDSSKSPTKKNNYKETTLESLWKMTNIGKPYSFKTLNENDLQELGFHENVLGYNDKNKIEAKGSQTSYVCKPKSPTQNKECVKKSSISPEVGEISAKQQEDISRKSSELGEERSSIYSDISIYSTSGSSGSEGELHIVLHGDDDSTRSRSKSKNLVLPDNKSPTTEGAFEKGKQIPSKKGIKGNEKMKASKGGEICSNHDDKETFVCTSDTDHDFRKSFIMNLMKNLKCNLFYDVFCFSMPKTDELKAVYIHKVSAVTELIGSLLSNQKLLSSLNIPSKQSLDQTYAVVQDMWKRYDKVENSNDRSGMGREQELDQEVDNDLPNSAVFVLSDLEENVKSSWPGQFLATVNPVTNVLSVSFFMFHSNYTKEAETSFANRNFTKDLSVEIASNMETFEMSRQFKMEIPLCFVSDLQVFDKNDTNSDAILVLRVEDKPKFYQRRVHTSAFLQNQWKKRKNFLPLQQILDPPFVLFLGGATAEISDIAALMINSDTNLKEGFELQTRKSLYEILKNVELSHQNPHHQSPQQNFEVSSSSGMDVILDSEIQARRVIILDILKRHKLITSEHADDLEDNPRDSCPVNTSITNNYLGGLKVHWCLYDYVNGKCQDVSQLERYLSSKLGGSAFGFTTEDLHIRNVKENSVDDMKVGEFLRHDSFESLYFSFCFGNITQSNRNWHCGICNQCSDWSTWHCPQCDHCTYGISIPICSYCGFAEGKTVIKPNSVFLHQVQDNNVPYDDIKEEWKIIDSSDDVPNWPDPSVDIQRHIRPSRSFDFDEFICDQLGLLDPMAFLLGSEARGVGSRQGRRRQKYKKKQKFNPAAAGCVLQ